MSPALSGPALFSTSPGPVCQPSRPVRCPRAHSSRRRQVIPGSACSAVLPAVAYIELGGVPGRAVLAVPPPLATRRVAAAGLTPVVAVLAVTAGRLGSVARLLVAVAAVLAVAVLAVAVLVIAVVTVLPVARLGVLPALRVGARVALVLLSRPAVPPGGAVTTGLAIAVAAGAGLAVLVRRRILVVRGALIPAPARRFGVAMLLRVGGHRSGVPRLARPRLGPAGLGQRLEPSGRVTGVRAVAVGAVGIGGLRALALGAVVRSVVGPGVRGVAVLGTERRAGERVVLPGPGRGGRGPLGAGVPDAARALLRVPGRRGLVLPAPGVVVGGLVAGPPGRVLGGPGRGPGVVGAGPAAGTAETGIGVRGLGPSAGTSRGLPVAVAVAERALVAERVTAEAARLRDRVRLAAALRLAAQAHRGGRAGQAPGGFPPGAEGGCVSSTAVTQVLSCRVAARRAGG